MAIAFSLAGSGSTIRARSGDVFGAHGQQYGGRTFTIASEFLRGDADGSVRALRHTGGVRGVAAAATIVVRLPRMPITLSDGPGGLVIRSYLAKRRFAVPTHRLAQGVLTIPDSIEEYLRGRHKQAVRTNIRRARSLGIRCYQLSDFAERRQFADLVDPDMTDPWKREQLLTRPESECWVAVGEDEEPIGLAAMTVDDEAALLWSLVSTQHPARWLLHTVIVDSLARRKVRHLLVAARTPLLLPPGIQHLQRLLGYRVTHISPGGPRKVMGSRRRGR